MSTWKRKALEMLPECRRVIETAHTSMALWIELLPECEDACNKQNEDLIRRFYDYARWCWQSPSADVRTAVAFAFYEHLPISPVLRKDMPRRLGRETFTNYAKFFGTIYHRTMRLPLRESFSMLSRSL